jgi:D-psicose/D-tagatose/L-ribulose 3-epimerase
VRYGASTFIWSSPFSDGNVGELAQRVGGLGFDVLEICLEDPALVTADAVNAAAAAAGVLVSVCGAFGPERDVSHESADTRRGARGYLKTCIELAVATGSAHVVGPMYSATGKARLLSAAERREQRGWAAESLREVGEYAGERGIALGMEPLNRFETDMVNTVEQGLELCEEIGLANVGLLLDTFHMNIEEKDMAAAIRAAGDRIVHFHACENDRGAPGAGHVPWNEVFDALRSVGYDRQVVIESFTPEIKEIARAVSTWRPVAESGDALAAAGLAFLQHNLVATGA